MHVWLLSADEDIILPSSFTADSVPAANVPFGGLFAFSDTRTPRRAHVAQHLSALPMYDFCNVTAIRLQYVWSLYLTAAVIVLDACKGAYAGRVCLSAERAIGNLTLSDVARSVIR